MPPEAAKTIYVKPREGYKIPDPDRKDFLPPAGREVAESLYWTALLRDKDVEIASNPDTKLGPVADSPAKRKS